MSYIYSNSLSFFELKRRKVRKSIDKKKKYSYESPIASPNGHFYSYNKLKSHLSDKVIPFPVLCPSFYPLIHAHWGLISNGKINGRIIALGIAFLHAHLSWSTGAWRRGNIASLGLWFYRDTILYTFTDKPETILTPPSVTPQSA